MHALPFLPTVGMALCCACMVLPLRAADLAGLTRYYDEAGLRHVSLRPLQGGLWEVRVRWAGDPGSSHVWVGQGVRKNGPLLFAAQVEEGQDPGTYFTAKGESKLEIEIRPGQKMPQDPGFLGVYRRVSDEKYLQLIRKEFQAADDRLGAALKTARTTWGGGDKAMPGDWKERWPALRERWMKIAYQPSAPVKPALPAGTGKGKPPLESDAGFWLQLAQTTAMGYYFLQQMPDAKSQEAWAGDYDDGFGGGVNIRVAADGRLRVSLNCTRVSELYGASLQGTVPAEAVKVKMGAEPAMAEAVFTEPELPEASRDVRVILKRKGGFLWVETQRRQEPSGRLAWLDGSYRWMPVPVE